MHLGRLGLQPGGFVYYEPTCGNLGVCLHVLDKYRPAEALVSDASPDYVNFFKVLQSDYAALICHVTALARGGLDEHACYALRRRFTRCQDPPAVAAALFYLLHHSRTACRSRLCVVTPRMWAQLHRAHKLLTSCRVHLACVEPRDFLERNLADARCGHLLYCDPPRKSGDCLMRWAAAGAHVVVANSVSPRA